MKKKKKRKKTTTLFLDALSLSLSLSLDLGRRTRDAGKAQVQVFDFFRAVVDLRPTYGARDVRFVPRNSHLGFDSGISVWTVDRVV